jgi:excisionase family DNA binding protein
VSPQQLTNAPPDVELDDLSLLTVGEVASVMRVSKMTVYRMVHSGELTALKVGRGFRIPARVVRAYLAGAYVGGQDTAP